MDPIARVLEEQPFVLLDGGFATELERHGFALDDALWSARALLQRPDLVRTVHASYFEAGADVATTATYQASIEGFAAAGIDAARAEAAIRAAIDLASAARPESDPRPRVVAGSLGSYGAYLADGSEYRGQFGVGIEVLIDFHRSRIGALAASDMLAFETIPCRLEVEAIVEVLRQTPDARAWVSLQCADEHHTAAGEPVEEIVALLDRSPGVVAIAINCVPPARVEGWLRHVRTHTDKPLLAYPNSAERWVDGRWSGDPCPPDAFAQLGARWWNAGARGLGGCCRTTPEHIRALHRLRRKSDRGDRRPPGPAR